MFFGRKSVLLNYYHYYDSDYYRETNKSQRNKKKEPNKNEITIKYNVVDANSIILVHLARII